jgi:asparagine synthase (glutamine-hydrolysing)
MHSADGRYVITYNGEIYNFGELRRELETLGHAFRGTSDTEVMLAACVQWGITAAVGRFVGMFAFGLFDRQTRTLHLVRDRVGVKPMYWTVAGGTLLFGSELRALMAHPAFRKNVDAEALDAMLRYSYVPAPATIFKNVFKLPPASILTVRAGEQPVITSYWNVADIAARAPVPRTQADAVEMLDGLLRDSVKRRMIADVPLGAFLSGGTDSSIIVALMQAVSDRPAKTYTIGLPDSAYDESAEARAVARHLGSDHTEIMLEPSTARDLVSNVADWFDEPFGDSSQIPTYLVAKATRAHVTVALSGDGGDELFGGYPKYGMLENIWRYAGKLPGPVRAAAAGALGIVPDSLLQRGAAMALDAGRAERIGEKVQRLRMALNSSNADEAAVALATVGLNDRGIVRDASGSLRLAPYGAALPDDVISRMQVHDMQTYLPDDILTKVDRCTMAVSLEAREPLLDHRLIEFVWSLPSALRRGDGTTKYPLRAVLSRYLPQEMIDRPKRGFSVPLGAWLRGPLRGWAEELLAPDRLMPMLDARRVQTLWQSYLNGGNDNATGMWNILMAQAWARRWL